MLFLLILIIDGCVFRVKYCRYQCELVEKHDRSALKDIRVSLWVFHSLCPVVCL